LIAWSTASSLLAWPHSISYFNELVGGLENGHRHLLDSNVAWGQDLLFITEWLDDHPEARPVGLATIGWIDPRMAGIDHTLPPLGPSGGDVDWPEDVAHPLGPMPGWYLIDANFLHGTHWPSATGDGKWRKIAPSGEGNNFEYFQRFQPVDRIGGSMFVYHITLTEANRVRKALRLRALDSSTGTSRSD
jgi:hypothetical protein